MVIGTWISQYFGLYFHGYCCYFRSKAFAEISPSLFSHIVDFSLLRCNSYDLLIERAVGVPLLFWVICVCFLSFCNALGKAISGKEDKKECP